MRSPGSSVISRERSATRCPKPKISSSVVASCTISSLTRVRRVSPSRSTSAIGVGGELTGVKPSWPLAMRFEPRSAQRRS
jgi:hypothetical protein